MHPDVALAITHAREQDLQRSTGSHRLSYRRRASRPVPRRLRVLPKPHFPLVSHRTRLGH
jgi:hypothetical protein